MEDGLHGAVLVSEILICEGEELLRREAALVELALFTYGDGEPQGVLPAADLDGGIDAGMRAERNGQMLVREIFQLQSLLEALGFGELIGIGQLEI